MYVIIVDFEIDPEQIDAFLPLMCENASASARDEPGCRQFDVCHDPDHPGHVFLYEVLTTAPLLTRICRSRISSRSMRRRPA